MNLYVKDIFLKDVLGVWQQWKELICSAFKVQKDQIILESKENAKWF